MNSVIEVAVARALAEQPWFARRKDTLAAVAGTVLQLANVAAAYTTQMPEWANVLIAVLIGAAQVVVHATTPGAITPSQAQRLEVAAGLEGVDTSLNPCNEPDPAPVALPVYDGPTTAPTHPLEFPAATVDYEGRHRAD